MKLRTALVFPPFADATQPHASLPALAGALHARGLAGSDLLLLDANLDFVSQLLTEEQLAESLRTLEAREGQWSDPKVLPSLLRGPHVLESIGETVRALRSSDCFRDTERLDRAKRLVREALEIHAARWAPYPLRTSRVGSALDSVEEVERWVGNEEHNPFFRFLLESVIPRLRRHDCGVVGISLSYRSQIVAAATLGTLIHRCLPGVSVVMGGNLVSVWSSRHAITAELFRWADFFVPYEGEEALSALLSALETGKPFESVPNLVYRQNGVIRDTPLRLESLDELPGLRFHGLPLGQYLAPTTVFPSYTSRGCYWARCAFCSVSPPHRPSSRSRPLQRILAELAELRRLHGARLVFFVDDCVPSRTLRQLSDALLEEGPGDLVWQCETRLEPSLTDELLGRLSRSGCRNLIFGLESWSSRVLASMQKGTDPEEARRILNGCREHGIAFNLQLFFGFPGETPEEAQLTIDQVLAEAHGGATFSFGTFELQAGSAVERDPAKFGVHPVRSGSSLAVRLEYEPVPSHAVLAQQRLQEALVSRMRCSNLGLGLSAHTLVLLGEIGAAGIDATYQKEGEPAAPQIDDDWLSHRWRRGAHRMVTIPRPEDTALLLYDYEMDRVVEISPLVGWLLARIDERAAMGSILEDAMMELAGVEGMPLDETLQRELIAAVRALASKGFIRRQTQT